MPRGMRIREPNQDDRPGLPNAEERTSTNQPFDADANREMIERNAVKNRERDRDNKRANKGAGRGN